MSIEEEDLSSRSEPGGTSAITARLSEQIIDLQRQIISLQMDLQRTEDRGRDLTDAKFVTYRTLIDSQADKVKLALEATEKAIDKAEIATSKAIDKESSANNDRFAAVNEFRAQLSDLISRFATLERVDLLYNQTRQRIDEINNNLTSRISEHGDRITAIESTARGAAGNKNGIYAALGATVAIISIIVIVANMLN